MKAISYRRISITAFLILSTIYFMRQYHHLLDMTPAALGKYYSVRLALFGHIMPASIALLTAPFQFIKSLRNRYLTAHRWTGRLYIVCILLSILSALYLTFTTTMVIGKMYTFSLWFLLLAWFITTYMTYITAKQKKFKDHSEWAVRSYLVTFAFIIQNYILKLPGFDALGSFAEVSPNMFWLSWSIPLLIYQVYLSFIKNG
ncbi:MAG: DUF2306 domain-containing protein [Sphingobacteriales bacterium]|nr:MAG: DUF2306 domain-containing protein [Sphingobacteriales bacterium]